MKKQPKPQIASAEQKAKVDIVRKCSQEVEQVLTRHGCRLTVVPQVMFGQKIYVPVVEVIHKDKP